ncbi:hypothetical protein [Paractinoplanes durhamensis]|uniref:Uncharacterized protein n=1 Tax=Paractinoplanes durhamensis TaxID=113563 RepID=A0ABQ3Z5C4_9ACTN|nr:hypothetical protein [Actinoplanes durhamensis]GIE04754.1 hypothetical protein Adu01nite_61040 [Actinoplanes durhamensis]
MSVTAVLTRNRRLAAGLLTAMTVATLAACGSSDDSSGDTSNTGTSNNGGGGNNSGFAAYIQCLSTNGVTITMPSGGPGGGNGGTRPSGAPDGGNGGTPPSGAPGGGNGGTPPSGGAMPSGGPGGGGGREISKPDGVDDATWTKATEACASQKPSTN